jgi:hypothetical protein
MAKNPRLLIPVGVLLFVVLSGIVALAATLTVGIQQRVAPLVLIDGTIKRVGPVVAMVDAAGGKAPVVAIDVDGRLVLLAALRDSFDDPPIGSVNGIAIAYVTTDCTGSPYVLNGLLFPDPGSAFSGGAYLFAQRLYVSDGPVETLLLKSANFEPSQPTSCTPIEGNEAMQTIRVRFVTDLSTEFPPPYSVR